MTADAPSDSRARCADGGAWDRQSQEGSRAYRAFRTYLELGPDRTLDRTAHSLGRSLSLIKRWSARHQWRARAAAADGSRRRNQDEQARSSQREVYKRRLAYAEHLEKVAMAGLRTLLVRDPESEELRFARGLKPGDICALVRVAVSLLPTPPPESGRPSEEDLEGKALGRLSGDDLDTLLGLLESHEADEGEQREAPDEDAN